MPSVALSTLAAAAWLLGASAHSLDHHVHGVVAFIRSGERTPNLANHDPILTSVGAQQMYRLGNIFRGKYIEGGNGNNTMGEDFIPGLAARLDNDQVFIHAYDAPHIYGSAQAFMQGLYPPSQIATNGSTSTSPLGGYQYPHIQTVGQYDPQSIYVGGDKYCPTSIQESRMYETTNQYLETKMRAQPFYQGLPPSLLANVMQKKNVYVLLSRPYAISSNAVSVTSPRV